MGELKPATIATYKWRKRCAALGGQNTLVSSDKTRAYIEFLRKNGWTHSGIEAATGIEVDRLFKRNRKKVSRETEAAILAIDPTEPAPAGLVSVKPVVRHINALKAAGWTIKDIAEHAGVNARNLYHIANKRSRKAGGGELKYVMANTANRIFSVELPPIKSEDVDEVVVARLADPHRDKLVPHTPAEMARAIDLVSRRSRVHRKTASHWINYNRKMLAA